VIKEGLPGHSPVVSEGVLLAVHDPSPHTVASPADPTRLRAMVDQHLDFTWRSLRRLGLPEDVVDDATQRVFLVASQRLADIQVGCEKAFLFNTAVRVASSERRAHARRREVLDGGGGAETKDSAPAADELLDRERARKVLEDLLDELAMELRVVFVLFELEGITMVEIAKTIEVPEGTVASRLRRARQEFQAALKRYKARSSRPGSRPGGMR
jgi:RNA polymerase sigma-70 factor, ECF subfamily